jgi:Lambda phage tail tape-measure protein (Tape_meas_lam_C)
MRRRTRRNPLCLPLFKGENADSEYCAMVMLGFLPLQGGGQVGVKRQETHMNDFENDLASAADALRALAEGPGAEAANALEAAFGQAGQRIGTALSQAARSGELDFQRMADAVLRDLARIAAEAVFGTGQQGSSMNVNMNFAPGTEQSAAVGGRNAIGAVLARLVGQGGRFL